MAQPPVSQFSGIFVSYRRDDSSGHAGRLFDNLAKHFGEDQIFMDIDTIEPGEDFVEVIEKAVGSCEIVVAVMGPRWLSSSDGELRRLDNPNDFVRLEIATTLKRSIRLIPVLVQKATMPRPQDLPEDIAALSRRNAIEISDSRWQYDVARLIKVLEKVLAVRQEARLAEAARQEDEERQRQEDEHKQRAEEEKQTRLAAEEANRRAVEDRRLQEEKERNEAEKQARHEAAQAAARQAEAERQRLEDIERRRIEAWKLGLVEKETKQRLAEEQRLQEDKEREEAQERARHEAAEAAARQTEASSQRVEVEPAQANIPVESPEPAQVSRAKSEQLMYLVDIACLAVVAGAGLVWLGGFHPTWDTRQLANRYLLSPFICLLILAAVATARKANVPPTAQRSRLFVIVAGFSVLLVNVINWGGAYKLGGQTLHFMELICMSGLLLAVISFIRNSAIPPSPTSTMAGFITASFVGLIGYLLSWKLVGSIGWTGHQFIRAVSALVLTLSVIGFGRKTNAATSVRLTAALAVTACVTILLLMDSYWYW